MLKNPFNQSHFQSNYIKRKKIGTISWTESCNFEYNDAKANNKIWFLLTGCGNLTARKLRNLHYVHSDEKMRTLG